VTPILGRFEKRVAARRSVLLASLSLNIGLYPTPTNSVPSSGNRSYFVQRGRLLRRAKIQEARSIRTLARQQSQVLDHQNIDAAESGQPAK
jgi:hypothetical protein